MDKKSVALLLYAYDNPERDAFTDDTYKPIAEALAEGGFDVETVLYHDSKVEQLKTDLLKYDIVLGWVDPVIPGSNRCNLDPVLQEVADKGVFVSTHPEVTLKIGTKKVLYTTKDMDWGGDVKLYTDFEDFKKRFLPSFDNKTIRVLKQYRGSSGNGIFKVWLSDNGENVHILPAQSRYEERILSKDDFYNEFSMYFENGGCMIDQKWADGIVNGVVRCFMTGNEVGCFSYNESVALCPDPANPSKRRAFGIGYPFTRDCGLFQDLRKIMEEKWVPELKELHSISEEKVPLLWDFDFFINDMNEKCTEKKYTLCEINVSCVHVYPQYLSHFVDGLKARMNLTKLY